jgi:hypothetical protein
MPSGPEVKVRAVLLERFHLTFWKSEQIGEGPRNSLK